MMYPLAPPGFAHEFDLNTPQSQEVKYQLQSGSKKRSHSRKGRPTSAYVGKPESTSFVVHSNQQSVDSLTGGTISLNQAMAARRGNIPANIGTFEKEKLYEEKIALKKQRNDLAAQNTQLKTFVRALEQDLKKKDGLIQNLSRELRHNAAA